MTENMIGMLAVPAAAGSADSQLVMATWGLVLATFLLFLASIVPAVGQFRDWSGKKKAIASTVIPVLHATRRHVTDMRDDLLSIDHTERDTIAMYFGMAGANSERAGELEDLPGLSLNQRLEMFVLLGHLRFTVIHLSVVASGDPHHESKITSEEHLRQAIIEVQASILSLDRLDRMFVKFRQGTFTDEMSARTIKDRDVAEKQLVNIRREQREQPRK